ncbi:Spy0128 family protein [Streptococcus ruminantium]|uniref:Spy0128 family protein n=1 Tax=Streptococcus ruminantium TaxID=1917441 RepID=UPI00280FC985|nr:FctA domain-containing protein [Streptococcus ruminantium]MDQ8759970.1 FctA domain-containing protein [Streptococcus ruminantium]MDQ8795790.1 FctA domain-containing protein [Streptococcus ruminantium]MDQ8817268.1 FctA domain-containing protein [Streptococcus ruminantium]
MMRKKVGAMMLSILMVVSTLAGAFMGASVSQAQGSLIKDIKVDKQEMRHGDHFRVDVDFGGPGTKVKEGQVEKIRFNLQDVKVTFPSTEIELKNEKSQTLGSVKFNNNEAVLTFNKYAATLNDVTGAFYFSASAFYDRDYSQSGQGTINISSGSISKSITLKYEKGSETTDNVYYKSGVWDDKDDSVDWIFNVNTARKSVEDLNATFEINDELPETMEWDIDYNNKASYAVEFGSGNWISLEEAGKRGVTISFDTSNKRKLNVKLSNQWVLDEYNRWINPLDGRSISVRLKARLTAETMNNPAITRVTNTSTVHLSNLDWQIQESDKSASVEIIRVGGWAKGTVKGEVRIFKKIAGTETGIAGVEFLIESVNNTNVQYKIKTNESGIASQKGLVDGKYRLKEISAPAWIDFEPSKAITHEFEVKESDTEGKTFQIENTKKKIDIKVNKEWIGLDDKKPTILLQLYKNNVVEGQPISITPNSSSYTWKALDKTDNKGKDYSYTVKEVGENNGKVVLEGKIYTVEYIKGADNHFTIKNTLNKTTPARATIAVKKALKGRTLMNQEFEFILRDENGTELQRVKNAVDGSVVFKAIDYSAAGIYKYTIEEVNAGQMIDGLKYDDLRVHVTVRVSDDKQGNLVAAVEYPNDIEFNNEYVEPTTTTTTEESTTTTTTEESTTTTTIEEPTTTTTTSEKPSQPETTTNDKSRKASLPSTGEVGSFLVTMLGFGVLVSIITAMVYHRK